MTVRFRNDKYVKLYWMILQFYTDHPFTFKEHEINTTQSVYIYIYSTLYISFNILRFDLHSHFSHPSLSKNFPSLQVILQGNLHSVEKRWTN